MLKTVDAFIFILNQMMFLKKGDIFKNDRWNHNKRHHLLDDQL